MAIRTQDEVISAVAILPESTYTFQIIDIKAKNSKKSGKPMYEIKLEVIGPDSVPLPNGSSINPVTYTTTVYAMINETVERWGAATWYSFLKISGLKPLQNVYEIDNEGKISYDDEKILVYLKGFKFDATGASVPYYKSKSSRYSTTKPEEALTDIQGRPILDTYRFETGLDKVVGPASHQRPVCLEAVPDSQHE